MANLSFLLWILRLCFISFHAQNTYNTSLLRRRRWEMKHAAFWLGMGSDTNSVYTRIHFYKFQNSNGIVQCMSRIIVIVVVEYRVYWRHMRLARLALRNLLQLSSRHRCCRCVRFTHFYKLPTVSHWTLCTATARFQHKLLSLRSQ